MSKLVKAVDHHTEEIRHRPSEHSFHEREARREEAAIEEGRLPDPLEGYMRPRNLGDCVATLVVRDDGRLSIRTTYFESGKEPRESAPLDPALLRREFFTDRASAVRYLRDPSLIDAWVLRPAEGFETNGPFGSRPLGAREFAQLRKEGRLFDVLRITIERIGPAWNSVMMDMAFELEKMDRGVKGPNRNEILYLGYQVIVHDGWYLFSCPLGVRLQAAMAEEGVLVDALEQNVATSTSPGKGHVYDALDAARRAEKGLPQEKRIEIASRREAQALRGIIDFLEQDKPWCSELFRRTAQLLESGGFSARFQERELPVHRYRELLCRVGLLLIDRGYTYMLWEGQTGAALRGVLESESRLVSAIEARIARCSSTDEAECYQRYLRIARGDFDDEA
jgi:hypothetical protein